MKTQINTCLPARPWGLALLVLCLLAAGLPLWAQQAAAPAAPRTYSLDFVDTELPDVVRALAVQSGANLALKLPDDAKATNTITLHLQNVTLEEAVRIVSGLGGMSYAQINDRTYVLGQVGDDKNPGIRNLRVSSFVSRVVTLRLTQKPDFVKALLKETAPEVICSEVPGTRSLVLVGPAPALDAAQQCLASLLSPDITDARTIIYEVKYTNCGELRDTLVRLVPDLLVELAPRTDTPYVSSKALGEAATGIVIPQTESSGGGGGGAGGGAAATSTQAYDKDTGMDRRTSNNPKDVSPYTCLILTGSPATLDKAQLLLAQLDVAPKLVTINAMITELRSDVTDQLGIDWSSLGGKTGLVVGEDANNPEAVVNTLGDETVGAREFKVGKFFRSPLGIPATINALVTQKKAKILSNPTITLLDGRQATIHSGERIYYPQIVGYTPLGGQIVQATQIDTGVTLAVNPRITPEGDIVMTLVPTVSDIAESRFAGYPTIVERSVVTTVRVKNGETLVLGGLVRDEMSVTTSKVPLLGDIPLIGDLLFKSRTKTPRHSEVLIFITPTVKENQPRA